MHPALVIAFVGALVFGAHLFIALFAKIRVPDVLLLICIGLLLGPLTHLVSPADFGSVGPVFTTVTLVLILFESGIGLRVETLKSALPGTLLLAVLNFTGTAAVAALAAWKLAHLGPMRSVLLGTILGGTSPAVVIPMSAQLQMSDKASAMLFLESSVSDVLSIILTLGLLDGMHLGGVRWGHVAGSVVAAFLVASLIGILGALFWSSILNRTRTLQNAMFTTAAFVFLLYGVTEMLGYSGAIAALAFGIGLGNELWLSKIISKRIPFLSPVGLNENEKSFFAEIVFLLKTFFFVYIGLSIQFHNRWWIGFGFAVTVLIYLLRIPVVRFGVARSIPQGDACRMAAMAPKGLAAAVLAGIPLQQGVQGGDLIQNSTYAVVLFSIVFTSILIFLQDTTPLGAAYRRIFRSFGAPEQPEAAEERLAVQSANEP
jgi:cell volume regulation protein A